MRGTRGNSAENDASSAATLAAADDARLRQRIVARTALLAGLIFVAGSLLLWPKGLFALGNNAPTVSVALTASGALPLLFGIFSIAWSVRRLSRPQNNYYSTGKPDTGFVFQPDIGLPQIGQGHGGPMDASVALFANPDKVNNCRR